MFHGGETADEDGLDLGFGLLFGLLALPGVFSSLFLADKYGSLFQVLRGDLDFDPYAASLPDEYFFIALSMVVTAAVAVWKWDSLLPDRRDYINLAPLPISSYSFLGANTFALLLLVGTLAIDVNIASIVLFPLVVCGSHSSLTYFAIFLGAHLVGVTLASVFSFSAVLTILCVLMSVLPFRLFRKCSLYVRCVLIAFILAILSSSATVPQKIHWSLGYTHQWLNLLPTVWFTSLNQWMLGRTHPTTAMLGKQALIATGLTFAVALCACIFSFRRCFTSSGETNAVLPAGENAILNWIYRMVNRLVFQTPFERAAFRFTTKALARGESQALVLGWFVGLGIVISSQSLVSSLAQPMGPIGQIPSAEILSVPLTLSYFLILGLRCSFEVPIALRANWLFRLTVNPESRECSTFARKVIFVFLLPALLLCCLPLCAKFWGWKFALVHVAIVTAVSVLLIEIVSIQFRKIPFTCSMPRFRSNSIVVILIYVVGFFVFSTATSTAEHWAFQDLLRLLTFLPVLGATWLGIRYWQKNLTYLDTQVIFDEFPASVVETMNLGVGP
jgi:hypothetical protein